MTEVATRLREEAGGAERDQIVEVARELGRRELGPRALELDELRPGALEAAWEKVTEVGFDRALVGVENGGAGLDPESLLLCLEEMASGDAGVAMLVLLSNAAFAALPGEMVARIGNDERWAVVPAPPEELPGYARVQVGGGSGEVLDGELAPALGALGANGFVIVTHGSSPAVLALPADEAGVGTRASAPQLGLRAAAAARIFLSEAVAELPSAAGGAAAAARSMDLLRAGTAAIARGVAGRARQLAYEYALDRIQGGVPIIEHDAVRDMLAAMGVRLAAKPSSDPIAGGGDAALAAKVTDTEAAVQTTTDAVQIFGGTGYMHETGVEKLMRDAKYLQLWPEPNWIAQGRLLAPAG